MKSHAIVKKHWIPSNNLDMQRFGILFTRFKRHPKPSKRKIGCAPRCYRFSIVCHTHLHSLAFILHVQKALIDMENPRERQKKAAFTRLCTT